MKDTTIRLTIDLYCMGGFDESELSLIARRFADGDVDRRGEIEGLHGSVFQGFAINHRGAILDRLAVLRSLDAEKAGSFERRPDKALSRTGADAYWFSEAAADLLDELELAIDEAEADEIEPINPHDAEMEEAALSLHDPDTDLLDCYS